MRIITITMSLILVVAGLGFYFISESRSVTALIPSFVGTPLLILGILLYTVSDGARKHVAHTIAALALLGTLAGLGMGIPASLKAMQPEQELGLAAMASLLLGICCLVIVVTAVRSFIAARKARKLFADQDTVEKTAE